MHEIHKLRTLLIIRFGEEEVVLSILHFVRIKKIFQYTDKQDNSTQAITRDIM